ncbi:MAG: 50S ribosomal protein L11 methyltransferase, partial [Pygmaiobacter massiliensis]
MNWTDIKITVPKAEAETAEAIATGISGGGIYIEDYSDLEQQVEAIAHIDLIEQELIEKDRSIVAVHLYLSPDENPAEVVELLKERLQKAELHST